MSTMHAMPPTSHPSQVSFNEPHSLAIRIWHWTFVLFLTASLTTVLFGSTVFRTKNNIAAVQQELQQKGATVTNDQARAVAHAYSDKLWDLHKYLGYFLVGLLLCRIVIEFAQPGEERLRTKIRKAAGFKAVGFKAAGFKAAGFKAAGFPAEDLAAKSQLQHYGQVKWLYVIFYLLITTMALTGLGLAFEEVPVFREWHQSIKQIHQFVQYFIYAFILIHLIGVIRADLGQHKGLVSGMIHGKRRSV